MTRTGCLLLAVLAFSVLHGVEAKGPTVRVTIEGAHLGRPLEVTNPNALVNVWTGTRSSRSWLDLPRPFVGEITAAPDQRLPRYTVSFYVRDVPTSNVEPLYVVQYVPDPETGGGYVYLPRDGGVIVRPGDGKWNRASAEWSAAINARLAAAQGRPNFSGVWVGSIVPAPSTSPAMSPLALGQPVTITQDEASITIDYVSRGRSHAPVRLVYKLDGTETINQSLQVPASAAGVRQIIKSKAEWDGPSLILITFWDRPTEPRDETRDRLTLESPTTFRMETTRTVTGARGIANFQRSSSAEAR